MLELISSDPARTPFDTLAIPVAEGREIHDRKAIVALTQRAKKLAEFKGRTDDAIVFYQPPEVNAARVILLGIGKPEKIGWSLTRCGMQVHSPRDCSTVPENGNADDSIWLPFLTPAPTLFK